MKKAKVYYYPITDENTRDIAKIAKKLFAAIVEENNIILEHDLPLKIHTGEPGNVTFIKPVIYQDLIGYMVAKGLKPFFIETNSATGVRSRRESHLKVARLHGFTTLPVVIADGENGDDHKLIPISKGKYFKACRIASELANKSQVIVFSHFKGHIDGGFGSALKMLGIGFASGQGKMEVHCKNYTPGQKTIDWSDWEKQYHGDVFRERLAEYALSAVNKKQYIYLTFAINMTENCDCDGEEMKPVYRDLGIFASLDPVAIDKACFDLITKREGRTAFPGSDIFAYAEKLGLGTQNYTLNPD